ncbi:MAG: VanW family protein [Chloroflexota bacterium]
MSTSYEPTTPTERDIPSDERAPVLGGRGVTAALALGSLVVVFLIAVLGYQWLYADRMFPGVSAFGTSIGGMSRAEAKIALLKQFERYSRQPVEFRYADRQWVATLDEIGVTLDVERTLDRAYAVGRTGNPVDRLRSQFSAIGGGVVAIKPILSADEAKRTAFFARLARQIDQPVRDATLAVDKNAPAVVFRTAQPGLRLDIEKSIQVLEQAIINQSSRSTELVVEKTDPSVVDSDLQEARAQAEKMLSAPIQLQFEGDSWTLAPKTLAPWIVFKQQSGGSAKVSASLADEPLKEYLDSIAKKIDRPATNARFNYDESTGELSLLRPSVDGRKLDITAAADLIKQQAPTDERTVGLPVAIINPLVKAEDIGKLVVKDLIEEASTSYAGSVPERAHNIELAVSRLNGVVVAPGQVFSFNDELGPVTLDSGFQIGWGITISGTNMVTVPSEGGGICQVATTLFHPVFWAGYPIVERIGHLYWIPRYGEPPKGLKGLDATVDTTLDKNGNVIYEVDFKFENNTSNPILIQAGTDGKNVYFSLYGTKPDWQVKVDGPIIEDVVKASNETVRQEDPTLPVGKEIMIEQARDGFKSTIVRTVTRGGEVVSKQEFVSRYRPSRNVIVVGTKPPEGKSAGPATPPTTDKPSP